MSVLAAPRKGNRANWDGIEPMINKADGTISLGKIEPFLLAGRSSKRFQQSPKRMQDKENGYEYLCRKFII